MDEPRHSTISSTGSIPGNPPKMDDYELFYGQYPMKKAASPTPPKSVSRDHLVNPYHFTDGYVPTYIPIFPSVLRMRPVVDLRTFVLHPPVPPTLHLLAIPLQL